MNFIIININLKKSPNSIEDFTLKLSNPLSIEVGVWISIVSHDEGLGDQAMNQITLIQNINPIILHIQLYITCQGSHQVLNKIQLIPCHFCN